MHITVLTIIQQLKPKFVFQEAVIFLYRQTNHHYCIGSSFQFFKILNIIILFNLKLLYLQLTRSQQIYIFFVRLPVD